MPITYVIDPELGIVYQEFAGDITASELEDHWRALLADPHVPDSLDLFVDLRYGSVHIDSEGVQRIVRTVIEPLLGERRWTCAVTVGSLEDRNVMQGFKVYSERCGRMEVFEDMDDGIAWLVNFAKLEEARSRDVGPSRRVWG